MNRRTLLLGALALACRRAPPPLAGQILGADEAERGHRRVTGPFPAADRVDVAILGAGISGLCAAWRLTKAGFGGRVAFVDLADAPGGTAIGDTCPQGAHYVTLPNPGARHYRALLADLGVITGWSDGRPVFDDRYVCWAPQERLFDGGEWVDGLLPTALGPASRAQLADFEAVCQGFSTAVGSDGLRAFDIPVARSSRDPAFRALADVSFAAWLDAQGYDDPVLRWSARYATRDDFGAEPEQVSAWAGLHYHAARVPDPAVRDLATNVLTWPAGNGWLVRRLLERIRWPVAGRTTVVAMTPEDEVVRLGLDRGGELRELVAGQVIAALPSRVVARWLPVDTVPDLAPWRVAALYVSRLPRGEGVPFAWDSVRYGARGLGYVSNVHQTGMVQGPAVLTAYDPVTDVSPAEGRKQLLAAGWDEDVDGFLSDLAPAHPDLREVVTRVDLRRWGHGTAIPAVGLHRDAAWHTSRPHPRVALAHTDRSGVSLFEEAAWHGIRAAEDALEALGHPVGARLT